MTSQQMQASARRYVAGTGQVTTTVVYDRQWNLSYQGRAWRPPTDVYETVDAVMVKLEVAGILTVATNTSPEGEITLPLGSAVDRVIIQVDMQRVLSTFVIIVSQGGVEKGRGFLTGENGQLVFDVAP